MEINAKILERVPKFSHLGLVMDENLTWKDHVEYASRWKPLTRYTIHS